MLDLLRAMEEQRAENARLRKKLDAVRDAWADVCGAPTESDEILAGRKLTVLLDGDA